MYTNGEVIIERKNLTVEITTEKSTIIYSFSKKTEAFENFIRLIEIHEKIIS